MKLVSRGAEGELLMEGRLDSAAAPEAERIIMQVSDRFDRLLLNLSGLEYMSSAGLRVLKNIHVAMKKKHGEMVLKSVPPPVMEVLEMTGFAGLLKFV